VAKRESFLDFGGTVIVSVAAPVFVCSDSVSRITLGSKFIEVFEKADCRTECPAGKRVLRYHVLLKDMMDSAIIAELGGWESLETDPSDAFWLVEQQLNGEDGVLLRNGHANVFFRTDKMGVRRAVLVCRRDRKWRINAYALNDPHQWSFGSRVFTRVTSMSAAARMMVSA
jgi:hypothetical protein